MTLMDFVNGLCIEVRLMASFVNQFNGVVEYMLP